MDINGLLRRRLTHPSLDRVVVGPTYRSSDIHVPVRVISEQYESMSFVTLVLARALV